MIKLIYVQTLQGTITIHAISHPTVILLAFSGVFTAWLMYIKFPTVPEKIANNLSMIYRLLVNKYGFDDFNQKVFAGGAKGVGRLLWQMGDVKLIDDRQNDDNQSIFQYLGEKILVF